MEDLHNYAAIAEIAGALTILGGGMFALIQFTEIRRRRSYQVAADLCRAFAEPDLARAVIVLKNLPDDTSLEEFRRRDPSFEEAAQVVTMTLETMGLLVHRRIASFDIVQELAGGFSLMMWRKMGRWAEDTRIDSGNPRFAEWAQWLVERLKEREAEMRPAFETHREWKPN